jgi:hypothetical protein
MKLYPHELQHVAARRCNKLLTMIECGEASDTKIEQALTGVLEATRALYRHTEPLAVVTKGRE